MNISFTYSSAPDIINKLAAVIYKSDANGMPTGPIVDSQQFNAPHLAPQNVTFTGLEPIPYIVNTYETTGLPILGQLRNSFIYNPEFSDIDIKVQFLRMILGDTSYNVPGVPSTDFLSWDGYKAETIDRRGTGILERLLYDASGNPINAATAEVVVRDGINDDPKGFDLRTPNDSFGDGELFVVTLFARITVSTPTYNISKVIYDERYITNDASVTVSDSNKGLRLQGATGVAAFTVSLPRVNTLDAYSCFFAFFSDGGRHVNVTLKAYSDNSTSDKIYIYNPAGTNAASKQYRNQVHLGQSEQFWIYNNATDWIVAFNGAPGILNVGTFIESYSKTGINQMFCDGGALYLRSTYRRAWEWISSLEAGVVVTDAVWQETVLNGAQINNKGFFSSGDGKTNFRFPQLYSVGYPVAVDGSARKPAAFSDWVLPDHLHYEFTDNQNGVQNTLTGANPVVIRNGPSGGNTNYDMRGRAQVVNGITALPYLGQSSSPFVKRNGIYVNEYYNADGTAKPNANAGLKGADYGVYKLINI